MQQQKEDPLTSKIRQLENYLDRKYPNKRLKIHDFIDDLNQIKDNLSTIGLLNHLVDMYKDGVSAKDIVSDVNKTKKIFNIASEYISSTQEDNNIAILSTEIHEIVLGQLEKALDVYQREYCI